MTLSDKQDELSQINDISYTERNTCRLSQWDPSSADSQSNEVIGVVCKCVRKMAQRLSQYGDALTCRCVMAKCVYIQTQRKHTTHIQMWATNRTFAETLTCLQNPELHSVACEWHDGWLRFLRCLWTCSSAETWKNIQTWSIVRRKPVIYSYLFHQGVAASSYLALFVSWKCSKQNVI